MPDCLRIALLRALPASRLAAANAPMSPNYSGSVLGLIGGDPSFRDDDGSADPGVAAALGEFAAGRGTERAALAALAGSRLLVPVVAVRAEELGPGEHADGGEKTSEMAMPTLIGLDGRRAIPAFTCMDSLRTWQQAARPVPAPARLVWEAAVEDDCAVVIDVAGPVRLAVEGSRLAAMARGDAAPAPWADPDVREVVADVLAAELAVGGFELRPGDPGRDLVIALKFAPAGAGFDAAAIATRVGDAVMARLGSRLRRGVAIWLGNGT